MGLRLIPVIHGHVGKLCWDSRASGICALESTQSRNVWHGSCDSQPCLALQQQHPNSRVQGQWAERGSAKAPRVDWELGAQHSWMPRSSPGDTEESSDRTFL